MASLVDPAVADAARNAWTDWTQVIAVRTNPILAGQVELLVSKPDGKRGVIRVQGSLEATL